MNHGKGNSFASGASVNNGNSHMNGPYGQEQRDGWHIRPATIWDHLEPGLPA